MLTKITNYKTALAVAILGATGESSIPFLNKGAAGLAALAGDAGLLDALFREGVDRVCFWGRFSFY